MSHRPSSCISLMAWTKPPALCPGVSQRAIKLPVSGHPGKDRQAEGLDQPGQALVGGPLREFQPQEVQSIFPDQLEPFRGIGHPLAEPGLLGRHKTRARYARP